MSTTDTEERLRAAFRAAERVITAEESLARPELLRQPRPSHRRAAWWGLAAAAAVVVAVACLGVALRSDRSAPPATGTGHGTAPTTVPTTTPTTMPTTMRVGPQPKRCDVALPATWQHAIAAGRVPGYLTLRTVDDAGNAYAVQTLGTTSQLVQILPDRMVRAIYRAGAGSHIDDVQVDGDWAVMAIVVGGNPNSHGGEARGRPSGIEAIRIGAREAVTILPGSAKPTTALVQPPVVSHGTVYWASGDSTGSGTMHDYDLATGRQRVLDKGIVNWPFVAGGGVYWFKGAMGSQRLHTERAGHLPSGYDIGTAAKIDGGLFQTDGAYAWETSVNANWVLRVAQQGARAVTVVRPHSQDELLTPLALAGSVLVYDDSVHTKALDWTTGAATTLPGQELYGNAAAGGHTLALQTGQGTISVLDRTRLPDLHC